MRSPGRRIQIRRQGRVRQRRSSAELVGAVTISDLLGRGVGAKRRDVGPDSSLTTVRVLRDLASFVQRHARRMTGRQTH